MSKATLEDGIDAIEDRADEPALVDLLASLDPFQAVGIPCWQSFAGPLEDAHEPTEWADNH